MAHSRDDRLSVGVVGLGRLWEGRYKAAFGRLSKHYRIAALYDQVHRRALMEAATLGCQATEGLTALVERTDVDVVCLLGPQWFGLHAAHCAQAAGKPIYCALPVAAYAEELEDLATAIRSHPECGSGFVPELARRFYPATLRLRELLATTLGAPLRITGHARFFGYDRYERPGPTTQSAPLPLAVDPGGNLIDWCRFVMQAEPTAITAFGAVTRPSRESVTDFDPGEDYGGFVLEFPGGRLAHLTFERFHREIWGDATRFLPEPGFQILAEHGAAWLEMPDHIHWSDAQDIHEERLPLEPTVGEILCESLYRRLNGQDALSPSLDDALIACRIVQALIESRQSGRRIVLTTDGTAP